MEEEFTIEKGIPAPPPGPRARGSKYPFAKMEPGDSFTAPNIGVRTAALEYRKKHPEFRYTVKKEGRVYRIWCLPPPVGRDK